MPKLLMLRGLPCSGKSTFARGLSESFDWIRVNFDDLRAMNGGDFTRGQEHIIQNTAYAMADVALERGKNVVWDNTSFHPKHEHRLRALAKSHNADFEIRDFKVTPEEAIKRDLKREQSVGEKVIWNMYYQYVYDGPTQVKEHDPSLPNAIIVDMDGTLARNDGHRGWYQWDKVGDDAVNQDIADLVGSMGFENDAYTIIVSGRDGSCYETTMDWLIENKIHFSELYTRAEGDNRPDTIVKREIYERHIEGKFNVVFVLDDRGSVCKMWGDELGLRVLQVRHPGKYMDF